jgi:hypothetical protein
MSLPFVPTAAREQAEAFERLLNRDICQLAQGFWDRQEHREVLLQLFSGLENRLLAAGFERNFEAQYPACERPQGERYVVWVSNLWTHPDCEAPFKVQLALTAHTLPSWRGYVGLQVKMLDDYYSDKGDGVLAGNIFKQDLKLADSQVFTCANDWQNHVRAVIGSLTLATLDGVFDQALAHLEAATTV